MSDRQAIVPPGMESIYDKIGYAPAVKVGNIIYVSGQIGRNAGMLPVEGREAQIVQAFENLKKVLQAADSSMADVVELTSYHTDLRDRYLNTHPKPAWTAIGAHMLGGAPGYIIEIKAVAVVRT